MSRAWIVISSAAGPFSHWARGATPRRFGTGSLRSHVPAARWVLPAGLLCAALCLPLVGLLPSLLMACGSVVVFVGARVLSLDDEATTIALVVCLGVAFTVGVATTAWLSDQAAAEARRAQDEALDAFMDSIVEDAVENAGEAAPECEDGAEWSASLDDGFVWARY